MPYGPLKSKSWTTGSGRLWTAKFRDQTPCILSLSGGAGGGLGRTTPWQPSSCFLRLPVIHFHQSFTATSVTIQPSCPPRRHPRARNGLELPHPGRQGNLSILSSHQMQTPSAALLPLVNIKDIGKREFFRSLDVLSLSFVYGLQQSIYCTRTR
jgi:hypothetical protein